VTFGNLGLGLYTTIERFEVSLMSPLRSRIRNVSGMLSSCILLTGSSFLDVFFPRFCLACGRSLLIDSLSLCADCRGGLTRVSRDDGLYQETTARLCAGGVILDLCVPFYFEKEGPLQALVHELKYNGGTQIGIELGREIGRRLVEERRCGDIDAVIAVPLHRSRLRERGYNQSEYLCRGIVAVTGIPLLGWVLVRRRNTSTQTALTAAERIINVADAFAVRTGTASRIRGRRILLVDDVITTGATIRASASVLRSHGVDSVSVASAAVAT
jgi:ComF family protein